MADASPAVATDAWKEYPANWLRDDTISCNATDVLRRLKDPKAIYFLEEDDDDINVRITDVNDTVATSGVYNDANSLVTAVKQKVQGRIRVISIYSERTIEPLQITSAMMRKILHKYEIHPDFLSVLFSFGEEPHMAEASSNNFTMHSPNAEETYITYQLNYVEENLRKGGDPWSFRHTGIYHHHTSELDIFIILHPVKNSVLEQRLSNILEYGLTEKPKDSQLQGICQDPYLLHLIVMSSFFGNWRWYFRSLGDAFAVENNPAMVAKPEAASAKDSFTRVKSLRNTNDFALFARACCSSNLDVVEKLKGSNIKLLKNATSLESQTTALRGHVESSNVLEGRIKNAIDLVGYTLTLHNQLETAKVDNELRDMTKQLRDVTEQLRNLQLDTVDDSTTVKIITYVSAFYLPGSFVSSLYGMNFFVFDQTALQLTIGNNFWIFIATWLPLTLVTGGLYIIVLWYDTRRKRKPFYWPWNSKPQRVPGIGKVQ